MNIQVIKTFLPVELYLKDDVKKTLSRFAITDNMPGLLDILQIVLDTCTTGLDNVVILDPLRPGKAASAAAIAAHYGMRKRSFSEKLDNVRTWSVENVEV